MNPQMNPQMNPLLASGQNINFRVSKGPSNMKWQQNANKNQNPFDGNELAGSSAFKGLENTASRLGNSGRFADAFNFGNLKKKSKNGKSLRKLP